MPSPEAYANMLLKSMDTVHDVSIQLEKEGGTLSSYGQRLGSIGQQLAFVISELERMDA